MAEVHKQEAGKGYLAVSPEGNFLCCNRKCTYFLPFLKTLKVDDRLPNNDGIARKILKLLDSYEKGFALRTKYKLGEMTCIAGISSWGFGKTSGQQGYLIEIYDGTEDQRNLDILSDFNRSLNEEVQEKTRNIKEIQRKVVLGMADLIEDRDSNTGGHVRRTSDIISIIVAEILRQGKIPLTEQQGRDIIRAAPTHDIGKIAIENKILNKPGRFTDEEYAVMKTHSAKSGEFVKILLEGVERENFVQVAYNVARYHHERWDGKGYPEGLVGSMIPLEARIMAVADVYDALVSKRVYKEPLSFEKSAAIMREGMGTQFDPRLKQVFLGCREELEQYYLQHDR
jgi:HD-GYP domain-containing protein (c-di-GMP phosphodiesterase class II)